MGGGWCEVEKLWSRGLGESSRSEDSAYVQDKTLQKIGKQRLLKWHPSSRTEYAPSQQLQQGIVKQVSGSKHHYHPPTTLNHRSRPTKQVHKIK
jgi:hypothetical protein